MIPLADDSQDPVIQDRMRHGCLVEQSWIAELPVYAPTIVDTIVSIICILDIKDFQRSVKIIRPNGVLSIQFIRLAVIRIFGPNFLTLPSTK